MHGLRLRTAALAAVLLTPQTAAAQTEDSDGAIARLAAEHVDAVLGAVAQSTRAVGEEFRRSAQAVGPADVAVFERRLRRQAQVLGVSTWPNDQPEPTFQSPYPGLFAYRTPTPGAATVDAATAGRLASLESLVPVVRAASSSLPFSWVYVTTAHDEMLIYPYLPLAQAVGNGMPSTQVFYTAADLARRKVGWTPPYLDLAGAGMMITASYPVFANDQLLGVASRDVTLGQLSRQVLADVAAGTGLVAILVTDQGLAIDASATELAVEIEAINAAKGGPALHYRAPAGLATAGAGAVASRHSWVNRAVEAVLAGPATDQFAVGDADLRLLAARVRTTNWLLVLIPPEAAAVAHAPSVMHPE